MFCSVPCCIYHCLLSSFVPTSLRMIQRPVRKNPTLALDRGSPVFCCKDLDISHGSIDSFLFRAIYYFTCRFGMYLSLFPTTSRLVYLDLPLAICSLPLLQLANPTVVGSNDNHLQALHLCCGIHSVHPPEDFLNC
jgi:hypothetical protein